MATLENVIERIKAEGQLTRNTGTNSLKSVKEKIGDLISTTEAGFAMTAFILAENLEQSKGFFEYLRNSKLQDEENRRELLDALKKGQEEPKETTKPEPVEDKLVAQGLLGTLAGAAGVGGVLLGAVSGFVAEITSMIRPTAITRILAPLKKTMKGLRAMVATVDDIFKTIRETTISVFRAIRTRVSNVLKGIRGAWDDILMQMDDIKKFFGAAAKGEGIFARMLNPIRRLFSFMGTLAKTFAEGTRLFFSLGKSVGRLLGKLAIPITVLLSVFESIQGAIKGFRENNSIFDAFKGGFTGLLNGLIGWAFDLPIMLTSWLSKKFGEGEIAKHLEGVTFENMFGALLDILGNIGEWIGEMLYTKWEGVQDAIAGAIDGVKELPKLLTRQILAIIEGIPGIGALAFKSDAIRAMAEYSDYNVPSDQQAVQERGTYRSMRVLQNAMNVYNGELPANQINRLQNQYGFTTAEINQAQRVYNAQALSDEAQAEEEQARALLSAGAIVTGSAGTAPTQTGPTYNTTNVSNVNFSDRTASALQPVGG